MAVTDQPHDTLAELWSALLAQEAGNNTPAAAAGWTACQSGFAWCAAADLPSAPLEQVRHFLAAGDRVTALFLLLALAARTGGETNTTANPGTVSPYVYPVY